MYFLFVYNSFLISLLVYYVYERCFNIILLIILIAWAIIPLFDSCLAASIAGTVYLYKFLNNFCS